LPQPTQIPPAPFPQEALQRVFLDLTQEHPYQKFGFLPDGGAQLVAGVDDAVTIRPSSIEIRTQIAASGTRERAAEKAVTILRLAEQQSGLKFGEGR
jgi:hypothetical protein